MIATQNHFRDSIKHLWNYLSEEEIDAHAEMRDVFFMAVRRKHGIPRAEAEGILEHVLNSIHTDANAQAA